MAVATDLAYDAFRYRAIWQHALLRRLFVDFHLSRAVLLLAHRYMGRIADPCGGLLSLPSREAVPDRVLW